MSPIGITEPYWSTLDEDQKLYWKVTTRVLALAAGLLVTKTGSKVFDGVVGAFATLVPFFLIETERSHKKYSPRLRAFITRVVIEAGSWGVTLLGLAIFAQVGAIIIALALFAGLPVVADSSPIGRVVFLSIFVTVCLSSVLWVFRQHQFEELIHRMPRRQLTHLLLNRPVSIASFGLFALFELTVLFLGFLYASTAAKIVLLFASTWASLPR